MYFMVKQCALSAKPLATDGEEGSYGFAVSRGDFWTGIVHLLLFVGVDYLIMNSKVPQPCILERYTASTIIDSVFPLVVLEGH
jgi:hypothetical protein